MSKTADLFEARYPMSPGFKGTLDTTREAATQAGTYAKRLQALCLSVLRRAGANGLTADECAIALGKSVLSIRPRFSELKILGLVIDSGRRRSNASGRRAAVWLAA